MKLMSKPTTSTPSSVAWPGTVSLMSPTCGFITAPPATTPECRRLIFTRRLAGSFASFTFLRRRGLGSYIIFDGRLLVRSARFGCCISCSSSILFVRCRVSRSVWGSTFIEAGDKVPEWMRWTVEAVERRHVHSGRLMYLRKNRERDD